jgi:DNA polymerase III epsilon subunit-like protein
MSKGPPRHNSKDGGATLIIVEVQIEPLRKTKIWRKQNMAHFVIPQKAASIHGITTERAKKEGLSLHNVFPQFNADVENAMTIISHNTDYDLPIINTEFLRSKIDTNLLKKQNFCTMKTPKIVSYCKLPKPSGMGYKWPALTELYLQLFKMEFTDSHNASADVEACAKCYFELRKRGIIE